MKDTATDFLRQFSKALNSFKSEQTVVSDSALTGTDKNRMLPLSKRLSRTNEEANARKALEDTQNGEATPDNDSLEEEMIQKLADDVIHKALEKMFGE